VGGKSHPRLNISKRPIAHKYHEGKVQRTLKKESKELEIVNREAVGEHLLGPSAQAGSVSPHIGVRSRKVSATVCGGPVPVAFCWPISTPVTAVRVGLGEDAPLLVWFSGVRIDSNGCGAPRA